MVKRDKAAEQESARETGKAGGRPEQYREYLKQILKLQQVESPVSTNALAEAMEVTPASVTDMLKKMAARGLIDYRPYHGMTLTEAGEQETVKAVRRHRIVERFLTDMLGFEWHQAHQEASAFELYISDEVERRMYVALNKPVVCPHGYPIPSSVEDTLIDVVPLYSLEPGQSATVVSVQDDEPELLQFMASMGIKPGATVKVEGKDPFKGPMQARVDRKKRTIGWHLANQVYVDEVS
jgi:DtxR family Mn-dependent transcriptional regulator